MSTPVSLWVEVVVGTLLLISGLLVLTGAVGLLRLKSFFQRLHAPAISASLGVWSVALASIVYFTARESRLELKAWLILILMAITVPVTTSLLARASLLRQQEQAPPAETPPES